MQLNDDLSVWAPRSDASETAGVTDAVAEIAEEKAVEAELAKTEPVETEAAEAEVAKAEPAKTDSVKAEPAEAEAAGGKIAEAKAAEPAGAAKREANPAPSESKKPARKPKKESPADKASAWLYAHSVPAGIGAAVLVCGVLAVTFWFTIFSGLSSSADFIYSQF